MSANRKDQEFVANPFASEAQRRFMWSQHPDIAEDWAHGEHSSEGPHKMPDEEGEDVHEGKHTKNEWSPEAREAAEEARREESEGGTPTSHPAGAVGKGGRGSGKGMKGGGGGKGGKSGGGSASKGGAKLGGGSTSGQRATGQDPSSAQAETDRENQPQAAIRNARANQPRHGDSGQYLPHGAGTGKGPVHQEAVKGHRSLTENPGGFGGSEARAPVGHPGAESGSSIEKVDEEEHEESRNQGSPLMTQPIKNQVGAPEEEEASYSAGDRQQISHDDIRTGLKEALKAKHKQSEAEPNIEHVYDSHMIYSHGDNVYKQDYEKATDSSGGGHVTLVRKPIKVTKTVSYTPTENQDMTWKEELQEAIHNCADPDTRRRLLTINAKFGDDGKLHGGADEDDAECVDGDDAHEGATGKKHMGTGAAHNMEDKAQGSNAGVTKGTGSVQAGGEEHDEYDNEEEEGKKNVKGKRMDKADESTRNQLAQALGFRDFSEAQSVLNSAREIEKRERVGLVKQLTANVRNDQQRKLLVNKFLAKPIGELRELLNLLPQQPPPVANGHYDYSTNVSVPNYLAGADGTAVQVTGNREDGDNDFLPLPTWNAAEEKKLLDAERA